MHSYAVLKVGGAEGLPLDIRVHASTYDANAPSEDRSTIVLDRTPGRHTLFAAVWDGHTGPEAAEYAAQHCATNFFQSMGKLSSGDTGRPLSQRTEKALRHAFLEVDQTFIRTAKVSTLLCRPIVRAHAVARRRTSRVVPEPTQTISSLAGESKCGHSRHELVALWNGRVSSIWYGHL